jgi:hypothetical protein
MAMLSWPWRQHISHRRCEAVFSYVVPLIVILVRATTLRQRTRLRRDATIIRRANIRLPAITKCV